MWARFVGVGLLFVEKLIMGIVMTFLKSLPSYNLQEEFLRWTFTFFVPSK
jgi:hypothetical protein